MKPKKKQQIELDNDTLDIMQASNAKFSEKENKIYLDYDSIKNKIDEIKAKQSQQPKQTGLKIVKSNLGIDWEISLSGDYNLTTLKNKALEIKNEFVDSNSKQEKPKYPLMVG